MENTKYSLFLLAVMIVNFFTDIFVFKLFDIDQVFILKTSSMLITLVYEKINFQAYYQTDAIQSKIKFFNLNSGLYDYNKGGNRNLFKVYDLVCF